MASFTKPVGNPYARGSNSKVRPADDRWVAPDVAKKSLNRHDNVCHRKENNNSQTASALVIAASDKAGMEGINRAKIDEIILRVSGDSLYMKQQRKRDEKVNQKISELQVHCKNESAKNPSWEVQIQEQLDREIPSILSERPVRSTCVVVDMDMFFMACELLTRPDLIDKPACVGGKMITTSNYVARKYGVRSAMAGYIGDKLVHELSHGRESLVHLPHNFELYRKKSDIVRRVLAQYDPALSAYSLDEVYLNISSYLLCKLEHHDWDHGQIKAAILEQSTRRQLERHAQEDSNAAEFLHRFPHSACLHAVDEIVREMRQSLFRETGGLTCSAGVAPNFVLAKIASDRNKPNGQLVIGSHHDQITQFLYPLPVRKVPGIGRVQEKVLNAFSIYTVQDLYNKRALVRLVFSQQPATATSLLRAAVGCSSSTFAVSDDSAGQKGISRERTFQPSRAWSEVDTLLDDIGRLLSKDMKEKKLWARTVTVKVKLHTFDVLSKSRSMPSGVVVQDSKDIVREATTLIGEIRNEGNIKQHSIRLLGIRCSNFGINTAPEVNASIDSLGQEKCGAKTCEVRSPPCLTLDRYLVEKKRKTVGALQLALSLPSTTKNVQTTGLDAQGFEYCRPIGICLSKHGDESNGFHGGSRTRRDETTHDISIVPCPMCGMILDGISNRELNQHIDACLKRHADNTNARSSTYDALAQGQKKRHHVVITDFFQPRI